MGLTLITGRTDEAADEKIRDHLAAGVRSGRESVLVVPAFSDVRRAREYLAAYLPVGIDVTTFDQWLEALWRRYGDGRAIVSSAVRHSIVAVAAAEAGGSLGAVASTSGFVTLIAQMAARAAGSARREGSDVVTSTVGRVLDRYEATLGELGLIEPGEASRQMGEPGVVTGLQIGWHRFANLSSAQLRLVSALMPDNQLAMALTWERGFPATEALDPIVDKLLRDGAVHVPLAAPAPSDELGWVEHSLYQSGRPLRCSGQVRLSEAAGGEAEAYLVAACASSAIADGFAPEQIVVAFRDLAERRELVGAALRAAGVPYAVDLQLEFRATPLGSALMALVSVESGKRGREALLHFLRGPFSDADAEAVEEIDARWRKHREQDGQRLLTDVARLTPALSGTVQLVRAVCRTSDAEADASNWQKLTALMLAAAADSGNRHEGDLRLDVAAHRLLLDATAQMATSGVVITGEELLEGIARAPVSSGSAERPGTVQVTEVHRIRSRRFDVVILGGLTAGEFTSEKREPLAVTLLGRMGLSEGVDERPAERMLFYLAVTRATGRLELVRQSADAAGIALRPSVFWEEMRDLYRTPDQTARGEEGSLGVSRRVSLSELEKAAPAFASGRAAARTAAAQGRLQPPGLGRGRLARAADLWTGTRELSVTEIEEYLACPYRWFYSRVIRPSEADRVFDARSRGSYAHALITGFYTQFREHGHKRVDGQNLASALRILDEVFSGMEQSNRWQVKGLREEVAAATARSWVRSAIEQDADMLDGFEPRAHEWAFGTEAGMPFRMGGVDLHGKVDRVDLGPAGVVVTDYKSSAVVHGCAEFEGRRLLQVAVYARAAADAFDAAPVAGVYRSLSARTVRGFWDTEHSEADPTMQDKDIIGHEQVSHLFSVAQDQIAAAHEGMRAGLIEPKPADKKVCEYCGARRSCSEARR